MSEDQDTSAAQPFLYKKSKHDEGENSEHSLNSPWRRTSLGLQSATKQSYHLSWLSILFHVSILATYSFVFIHFARKSDQFDQRTPELIPLPARTALQWETRKFSTHIINNPFAGEPRPELETAWHHLLRGKTLPQAILIIGSSLTDDNIHVANADLEALNLTSIYLKDGSEAVASLGVYHALHCLKKTRHMVYKDWYHKGKDELKMFREKRHVDHCIEYIREYLMCKPDLSLVTFHWINETAQHADPSARYPTQNDHCLHECANWEGISAWAGERVFDLSQTDLLLKPKFGLHYGKQP